MSDESYCNICRTSFFQKQCKSHRFSTRHKDRLKKIITDFEKKVSGRDRKHVEIKESSWETDAHFWCYFCEQEVPKHIYTVEVTICAGAMFEHLASIDHKVNVRKFWKENQLKSTFKQFMFTDDELDSFKVKAAQEMERFLQSQVEVINKVAATIHEKDQQRQKIVQLQRHVQQTDNLHVLKYESKSPSGTCTVAATGEGLTCLPTKNFHRSGHNVHSGALPPWQTSKVDNESKTMIGPSVDDLKKHIQMEKKRKLPLTRVGAKYSLNKPKADCHWLPQFGGVWSKSRRTHARRHTMQNLRIPRTDQQPNLLGKSFPCRNVQKPSYNHNKNACQMAPGYETAQYKPSYASNSIPVKRINLADNFFC